MISSLQIFEPIFVLYRDNQPIVSSAISMVYYLWQKSFSHFEIGYGSAISWVILVIILIVTADPVQVAGSLGHLRYLLGGINMKKYWPILKSIFLYVILTGCHGLHELSVVLDDLVLAQNIAGDQFRRASSGFLPIQPCRPISSIFHNQDFLRSYFQFGVLCDTCAGRDIDLHCGSCVCFQPHRMAWTQCCFLPDAFHHDDPAAGAHRTAICFLQ